MKERLKKKDCGMLDQILPVFVGILMLTVVLVLILGTMESIQTKNKVDLVARRGILLLETYGYLDAGMQAELREQLMEAGIEEIVMETYGYSQEQREWGRIDEANPALYGQKVELRIDGSVKATVGRVDGSTIFSTLFQKNEIDVHVVRVSTSKN